MHQPISLSSSIIRAGDLVSCDLDGETALMSVECGKYFGLNPIGTRIWTLIGQPRLVSELCSLILEEFEVEPSQCKHDVLAFLADLAKNNLVQVVDETV
jgi:hypothetical protein